MGDLVLMIPKLVYKTWLVGNSRSYKNGSVKKPGGNFCLNYFANSMLEFSRLPWLIAMLGTSRLDVVNTTVGNG